MSSADHDQGCWLGINYAWESGKGAGGFLSRVGVKSVRIVAQATYHCHNALITWYFRVRRVIMKINCCYESEIKKLSKRRSQSETSSEMLSAKLWRWEWRILNPENGFYLIWIICITGLTLKCHHPWSDWGRGLGLGFYEDQGAEISGHWSQIPGKMHLRHPGNVCN